jgi:hypothetical protein
MSQSTPYDDRLGATEAQMRRALGLGDQPSLPPGNAPSSPTATGNHRPARRFIRDGEVPVTVLHRDQDDGTAINKLEAARQALREQVVAREHAEQLLQEARATDEAVSSTEPRWLLWAREMQALAQTGLAFTRDQYDRERY